MTGSRFSLVLMLLGAFLFLNVQQASCVMANPRPIEQELEDGTKIQVRMKGDERGHWMEDLSGKKLVRTESGKYRYEETDQMEKVLEEELQEMRLEKMRYASVPTYKKQKNEDV
eukprot:CAMPEP_0117758558 /NCGR_PEP_ID=MMETSP0947-20121206/15454_1 /TAXON_ID=44440 /ORGANISM="Chattonella subsalsa, Strain CCMP2191" /LENGTH=113 /DNA_ID=CAMNT_0005578777 /DNA_START=60 /DNA_END=401 /DNA_ORIENTATION=+